MSDILSSEESAPDRSAQERADLKTLYSEQMSRLWRIPLDSEQTPRIQEVVRNSAENKFHQNWQKDARANGRKERWKPALFADSAEQEEWEKNHSIVAGDGTKYRTHEGRREANILEIDNTDLPKALAQENESAAKFTVGLLTAYLRTRETNKTPPSLDEFAQSIHNQWMLRHRTDLYEAVAQNGGQSTIDKIEKILSDPGYSIHADILFPRVVELITSLTENLPVGGNAAYLQANFIPYEKLAPSEKLLDERQAAITVDLMQSELQADNYWMKEAFSDTRD